MELFDIDLDEVMKDVTPIDDMKELKVGHIVRGIVACNFKNFSFVKIGNVSCVLPISEISYGKKPKNLKVGTEIEAVVIKVFEEQGVMLSIKRAKSDPWKHVEENYPVGTKLKRKVINLLNFGAFFEMEPGVEALLHRTEIGLTKTDKMKTYLSVGDELEVEVYTVDVENRKMSLRCDTFPAKDNSDIEIVNEQ